MNNRFELLLMLDAENKLLRNQLFQATLIWKVKE